MPTAAASSTATSNRPTSCLASTARHSPSIGASPSHPDGPTASACEEGGGVAAFLRQRAGGDPDGLRRRHAGLHESEQAAGRPDLVGPASDVYSLGALYALRPGAAPFRDEDTGVLLGKVRRGEFVPPRRVKADVPPALDAICRKAMNLRPDDRYASAIALASDVEHWLADEPVTAYPEPWLVRTDRWVRRHKAPVAAAAAALVMAAVVGGAGWLWHLRDTDRRATRAAGRVSQALAEADRTLAQARLAGSVKSWAEAEAAAKRAAELAAGGDVNDDLRRQAAELHATIGREAQDVERDRQMVARLEEIRIRRAEVRGWIYFGAVPAYAEVFRNTARRRSMAPVGGGDRQTLDPAGFRGALDEWA